MPDTPTIPVEDVILINEEVGKLLTEFACTVGHGMESRQAKFCLHHIAQLRLRLDRLEKLTGFVRNQSAD